MAKARVYVTLKKSVFDPQGKTIHDALKGLGYSQVADVRQGKFIEVELSAMPEADARATVERMCRELLANTVIENYSYEITRA